MKPSLVILGLAISALVGWVLLYPFLYGNPKVDSRIGRCLSNTRQQAIALMIYQGDFDDRFPPREGWRDAIKERARSEEMGHCPSLESGEYGYAFNSNLVLKKSPVAPESIPMLYESIILTRNASDPFTSLPAVGRHNGKNNIAYADSHARAVPAE